MTTRKLTLIVLLATLIALPRALLAQSLPYSASPLIKSSGTATVADETPIPPIDASRFRVVSVQLTGTWTGTVTFEASNDGTNWVSVLLTPTTSTVGAATATANGTYVGSINANFFRARFSTASSGTVVGTALFFTTSASSGTGSLGGTANEVIFTGGSTLVSDGTNIVAQKNGTSAQMLRIYNTYTGSADEWLEFNWQATVNTAVIRTATSGGTARALQLRYGNTVSIAMLVPTSTASPIAFANVSIATVANPAIAIRNTSGISATSGTHTELGVTSNVNPTATSTMAYRAFGANFTVNYSNGTPGAGSWEAYSARITETANPTGANYFFHFLGGAAGATEVAALTSAGELSFAGISGDTDAKALCKKADDTVGTCSSVVAVDGTCTCG